MTRVVIVGEIYNADLTIGGGPVYPDRPPGSVMPPIYYPPSIWGPTDPRPSHPIAPGGPPLGIWGGAPPPYPAHPIAPGGPPPTATPPIYYPPSVGGGPVYPPSIWGPTDPRPSHPIVLPPYEPGGPPVIIWGPTDPRPSHPIVINPPLPPPPDPPEGGKPPPPEGGWGFHPEYGWGYFPGGGTPEPKVPPA